MPESMCLKYLLDVSFHILGALYEALDPCRALHGMVFCFILFLPYSCKKASWKMSLVSNIVNFHFHDCWGKSKLVFPELHQAFTGLREEKGL